MMALGLGIEVASWSVTTLELQRAADAAALAGALNYNQTSDSTKAATAASNAAVINGIPSGNVTAAVVSGIKSASDTAIKVTLTQNVPRMFANIFSALGSVTVTASAWAELVAHTTGPQPCMFALWTAAQGGTGITSSGTPVITDPGCSVRSNAGVTLKGNATLITDGIYAAGSISQTGSVSVTGTEYSGSGTIPDSFQNYTALQTALAELSAGTGSPLSPSGTTTINPGTYSSLSIGSNATVTMNPGLYIINGPISFGGGASLTGTGVTIISSGSVSGNGNYSLNLTAPGASPTGGAVPGILMAGTGSSIDFEGTFSFPYTGVLYFPDGSFTMKGTSSFGGTGCAEVIAGNVTLDGTANFGGSCTAYGAPGFGSLPGTSTISLVQ